MAREDDIGKVLYGVRYDVTLDEADGPRVDRWGDNKTDGKAIY